MMVRSRHFFTRLSRACTWPPSNRLAACLGNRKSAFLVSDSSVEPSFLLFFLFFFGLGLHLHQASSIRMSSKVSLFLCSLVGAPAKNQSFSSKAVSHGPLEVVRHSKEERDGLGEELWIEGATPAACVNLALGTLFPNAFDFVISGPNIGHNLGR